MSEESKPPESTDPIEIEVNVINDLIGDNIILIIHQNGISIMMDETKEDRSEEQLKQFSRVYVATHPSFVLRFFLILEIWLLLIWESLVEFYESIFKKP